MTTAWARFVRGEPEIGEVAHEILASWQRSRDAGVDPYVARPVRVTDLPARLARNAALVESAGAHFAWITRRFATGHAVYLVDGDGIVLLAVGEPPELLEATQLVPGVDWSERAMGTNGAGTALAADQAIVVHGGEHWCRAWHDTVCCGCPIHGPDGTVVGAIDLTASVGDGHREHLLVIRHIAYAIEQELGLRREGADERALRLRAEAAIAARDELLAIVSHHLRTPLALVATSAALLERHLADPPLVAIDPALQIDQIVSAVERMSTLVQNLLDGARIDAGQVRPSIGSHSLDDILAQPVHELATLARRRGQTIAVEQAEAFTVRCDRALTMQIVWNLLDNAIKFAPDASTIEVRAERGVHGARIRVVDRGPGIEPDVLARVFDRYYQVQPRARQGVGLGLYIIKMFAELQAASVTVRSAPGRGSEFCLELPLAT